MVFPVFMYGCESWTMKKAECQRIDAFELWCWRRLLRIPWTARRWVGRPQGEGWDPLLTSLSTWWPPLRLLLAESLLMKAHWQFLTCGQGPLRHRPRAKQNYWRSRSNCSANRVWGNGAQQQPVLSAALGRAVLQSLYYTQDFFLLQ